MLHCKPRIDSARWTLASQSLKRVASAENAPPVLAAARFDFDCGLPSLLLILCREEGKEGKGRKEGKEGKGRKERVSLNCAIFLVRVSIERSLSSGCPRRPIVPHIVHHHPIIRDHPSPIIPWTSLASMSFDLPRGAPLKSNSQRRFSPLAALPSKLYA